MGEEQAALCGYLALLHVDPIHAGGVRDVCDLLDLKKGHPLGRRSELQQAAFASHRWGPLGTSRLYRWSQIMCVRAIRTRNKSATSCVDSRGARKRERTEGSRPSVTFAMTRHR